MLTEINHNINSFTINICHQYVGARWFSVCLFVLYFDCEICYNLFRLWVREKKIIYVYVGLYNVHTHITHYDIMRACTHCCLHNCHDLHFSKLYNFLFVHACAVFIMRFIPSKVLEKWIKTNATRLMTNWIKALQHTRHSTAQRAQRMEKWQI